MRRAEAARRAAPSGWRQAPRSGSRRSGGALIDLDEWGYPILKDRIVPDRLRAHTRRAVAACPRLALHTDDT
ncbi:hypothetical protein [Streptomyces soliscabiei]|uniref:hypothetical protein n=1 Tax=Streptomyces soliscabiei TaxID=588897 RepID=UPI0029BB85D1|nr:hypothetical protein [Streptomyces sp. NY05-11A]MDX2678353.1 hypothetical protein [Streptomyces sp. NY05-11A]